MFGFFKNKKQDYEVKINSVDTLIVRAGDNLLKAALEADIAWPHDCRVGSCGTCKCKLVDGKIKALADFSYVLEGDELSDGYILACQTQLRSDVSIEVELLSDSQKQSHWEADAVITKINDLTYDIKEVIVEIDAADLPQGVELYKAGQYADLKVPEVEAGRNYSFASAPQSGQNEFRFYIREVPGGEFTGWLFKQDRTGQSLIMSGPYGLFGLNEKPVAMTCVAGGSGMSAIISVLEQALVSGVKRDVRFLFGARTQADLYCEDLIQQLATNWEKQNLGSFRYIPCLSQEPEDSSWQGRRGSCIEFIVEDNIELTGQAYLCGPPGMIDAGIEVFVKNGITADQVFFDKFLDKSNSHPIEDAEKKRLKD
jgi:xylene monooxygenase electron transfer component